MNIPVALSNLYLYSFFPFFLLMKKIKVQAKHHLFSYPLSNYFLREFSKSPLPFGIQYQPRESGLSYPVNMNLSFPSILIESPVYRKDSQILFYCIIDDPVFLGQALTYCKNHIPVVRIQLKSSLIVTHVSEP